MSDDKVVSFRGRAPDPPAPPPEPPERIYICKCENHFSFRLFEDGRIQCRECGHIPSNIRTYNPLAPPP